MSSKNSVKTYVENGYYHIYNRGVEKRTIFKDKQDYGVFLSYLKTYLSPKNITELQNKLSDSSVPWKDKGPIIKLLCLNNFVDEINLLSYCLMPNHFHLLVKQNSADSIDRFINSLNTRYVMYFNKKYKRVGPLYQDVYKAVLVDKDEYLLHLSSYIHRNPLELNYAHALKGDPLMNLTRQPSSLPEYLGLRKTLWIKTDTILSYFSNNNKSLSYDKFVMGSIYPNEEIVNLTIDSDHT